MLFFQRPPSYPLKKIYNITKWNQPYRKRKLKIPFSGNKSSTPHGSSEYVTLKFWNQLIFNKNMMLKWLSFKYVWESKFVNSMFQFDKSVYSKVYSFTVRLLHTNSFISVLFLLIKCSVLQWRKIDLTLLEMNYY